MCFGVADLGVVVILEHFCLRHRRKTERYGMLDRSELA